MKTLKEMLNIAGVSTTSVAARKLLNEQPNTLVDIITVFANMLYNMANAGSEVPYLDIKHLRNDDYIITLEGGSGRDEYRNVFHVPHEKVNELTSEVSNFPITYEGFNKMLEILQDYQVN